MKRKTSANHCPIYGVLTLEKGELTERKAVDYLIDTMERYSNHGFHSMKEKLSDNPNYFYKNTGFLDMILSLSDSSTSNIDEQIEEL